MSLKVEAGSRVGELRRECFGPVRVNGGDANGGDSARCWARGIQSDEVEWPLSRGRRRWLSESCYFETRIRSS